jgi:hypothetical protein
VAALPSGLSLTPLKIIVIKNEPNITLKLVLSRQLSCDVYYCVLCKNVMKIECPIICKRNCLQIILLEIIPAVCRPFFLILTYSISISIYL